MFGVEDYPWKSYSIQSHSWSAMAPSKELIAQACRDVEAGRYSSNALQSSAGAHPEVLSLLWHKIKDGPEANKAFVDSWQRHKMQGGSWVPPSVAEAVPPGNVAAEAAPPGNVAAKAVAAEAKRAKPTGQQMTLHGHPAGHRWQEIRKCHLEWMEAPRPEDDNDECQAVLPDGSRMPLWRYAQLEEPKRNQMLWLQRSSAALGMDTAAPGVDTAAPGVDTAAPGVDTAAPGVDTAAPAEGSSAAPDAAEGSSAAPGVDSVSAEVKAQIEMRKAAALAKKRAKEAEKQARAMRHSLDDPEDFGNIDKEASDVHAAPDSTGSSGDPGMDAAPCAPSEACERCGASGHSALGCPVAIAPCNGTAPNEATTSSGPSSSSQRPEYKTLSEFMAMSFYEIFGAQIADPPSVIKKAYNALALIYHPDKCNGNPECCEIFKYIQTAYSVLMDKKQRARYNQCGKAEFASGFSAQAPAYEAAFESPVIFHEEPINVTSEALLDILSRKAAGLYKVVATDKFKQSLGSLRSYWQLLELRAGGSGTIPVVWHRDKLHKFVQQPGRWYSGVRTLDDLDVPPEFAARVNAMTCRGINMYRATVSLFDLAPRPVKELFRLGLDIEDLDQPKAFPSAMVERHPWSIHLRRWCEDSNLPSNKKVT